MKEIKANGYERIDRKEAFKMYKAGRTVYVAASGVTPSIDTISKIQRVTNDERYVANEFANDIDISKRTLCSKYNGKEIYFYKLISSPSKYKLSADFGDKVRLINIMTGQTVDVEKQKVIERMQVGMVEVLGYSVSPDRKNIIAYR